ncbi:MAG: threonine synthase [Candidatus Asgardarchaeia archaeon]
MDYVLRCPKCGREYDGNWDKSRCIFCDSYLDIEKDLSNIKLDFNRLKMREKTIWRYFEVLPIHKKENIVSLGEPNTPLVPFKDGEYKKAYLKVDYLFPTGSFKDRGSTVLVSKLKEIGVKEIVEDSSGNAGSSMAAYCRAAGIKCKVFVPHYASEEKVFQIESYGAEVVKVKGSRDDTTKAAWEEGKKSYYANHGWNPFFTEGTKTFVYEIHEEMNVENVDGIIVPIGSGTLILGVYKGIKELYEMGVISTFPKILGVQAEGVSPIYDAIKGVSSSPGTTIAEGIAVREPRRKEEIIEAIRYTRGDVIKVSNDEIIRALLKILKLGFFVEPTSATVIAAFEKYVEEGVLDRKDTIVMPLTGSGLKTAKEIKELVMEYCSKNS